MKKPQMQKIKHFTKANSFQPRIILDAMHTNIRVDNGDRGYVIGSSETRSMVGCLVSSIFFCIKYHLETYKSIFFQNN